MGASVGLPPSTRAAQTDWMRHCFLGAEAPRPAEAYRALDADGTDENDPAGRSPYPFPRESSFCTPTHQVRDLPGFRSLYAVIADEARRLAAALARHFRHIRGVGTRNRFSINENPGVAPS